MGQGAALGMMEDSEYHMEEYHLGESEKIIFLGTDGIWEACDAENEMYGKERLMKVDTGHLPGGTPKPWWTGSWKTCTGFSTATPRQDDITMVVLKMKGTSHGQNT